MWIRRLELNDIRCFDHFVIDFDNPETSVLLVGDNGDGKSTILRSLAMGFCDQSSAAALFRELPGEYVAKRERSRQKKIGRISIELQGSGGYRYEINTEIHSLEKFERVTQRTYRTRSGSRQEIDPDGFPWSRIFVAGYGPGVRVLGTSEFQRYIAVDAVYPMFNYFTPLQNPELVVRRMVDAAEAWASNNKKSIKSAREAILAGIKRMLGTLLRLDADDRVELTRTGIEISNGWGKKELSSLGDGYKAITTLALDLVSWAFLYADPEDAYHLAEGGSVV